MRTRILTMTALVLGSAAACATTPDRDSFPLPARVCVPVLATEPKPDPKPAKPKKRFDWIKLKTGEWLKGEIISMRNQSIEFDSAELDELTFDFEKIVEIRSDRFNTLVFEGQKVYTGRIFMKGDEIHMAGIPRAFDRSQLVSIVPGDMKEKHFWRGKITLGAAVKSGNVDQTDVTGYAKITRRGPLSRFDFTYNGSFGQVEGVDTANKHRIVTAWDVFLTRKWYVTPVGVEYYRDLFQNIRYRLTPYAGGGYYIFDLPKVEWDVLAGLGWRFEEAISVEEGEDPDTDLGIVVIGTNLKWDITPKVEWTVTFNLQVGIQDTSATNSHLFTQLSFDFIGDVDFDLGFNWDRVGDPVEDAEGNTPVPDDFTLSVGLGWDF